MLKFHVISIFPNTVQSYVSESILKRAQEQKHISVEYHNPIDYIQKRKDGSTIKRVDDKPYGGGPGMVIRAEPLLKVLDKIVGRKKGVLIIHLAPRAELFTNATAEALSVDYKKKKIKEIVIVCGRYEGIDSRVEEAYPGLRLSIGNFVLTGGEVAAMVIIDAITRQIDGVLGDGDSREEKRDAAGKYYTRPEVITHKRKKYKVPDVLLSGNHAEIQKWQKKHHKA